MANARLLVWDVRAGNSISLFTPGNKLVQFDIGATNECSPLTTMAGWTTRNAIIDTLVITHPHGDHLRDIDAMVKYKVGTILRPSHLTDQEVKDANGKPDDECVKKYLEKFKTYTEGVKAEENPLLFDNNGGVTIKHFHPTKSATSNINNHSIVSLVGYGDTKILIPGDCESAGWNELLGDRQFKAELKGVNILIASHHGHANGYHSDVMKEIKPTLKLVIVSDGKYNEGVSITQYYSNASSGCFAKNNRSAEVKQVKCLTTRANGWIDVSLGKEGFGVTVAKGV